MISKIMTAPWIGLPGEFEPGAQRWTQYDCNLLGDPALWILTKDPVSGIPVKSNSSYFSLYPNPSHGAVSIGFTLSEPSDVTMRIFDAAGQQAGKVYSWADLGTGKHEITIDLTGISSGIYFCRMETNRNTLTKKLVILR